MDLLHNISFDEQSQRIFENIWANKAEERRFIEQMLQKDKESCVRIVAAMALFQIANENIIPVLKERAKKDDSKTVRRVLTGIVMEMEQKYLAKL